MTVKLLGAIFVLFVRQFRKPSWRPFRGFLFSFIASSAFYPIIYASWQYGYREMSDAAGASRYAWTVLTYLVAVITYAVSPVRP